MSYAALFLFGFMCLYTFNPITGRELHLTAILFSIVFLIYDVLSAGTVQGNIRAQQKHDEEMMRLSVGTDDGEETD